ncbi:MAG TPA: type I DNA topoisomerase [Bacteroidales bacterium]|jgi:DNA topoisomerase-1|nr:type I DNA topoisomerase [Bacteroidales bacterium]
MEKNLVIVESPAKAKTIEKFLGKDFIVKSSFGHIRDLPKSKISIDIENNFTPNYEVPKEKSKIVAELKKLTKEAEMVWLASDEDREGEAISWHLAEVLNLNKEKTKRIVFHEITKEAIHHAIENPRSIDINLVNAQQARRILDRLVGYELSPLLWKKIRKNLSAGRVQSVAVRIIVEREREIMNFVPSSSFKVNAIFIVKDSEGKKFEINAELNHSFTNKEEALTFLNACIDETFTITDIQKKPSLQNPAPPFTTSTLQQEASRKLGFSVSQTMTIAQKLYESGHITYMRTDSVHLSNLALGAAKKEIENLFGKEYHKSRQYQTKSKGAQEAHEAIRPTYFSNKEIDGTDQEKRLYELIWQRAIASQMKEAQIEKTIVTIKGQKLKYDFIATGKVILFDGFMKLYNESTDEESENPHETTIPKLELNQILTKKQINATEKYTYHPPRYTEASLVKKLEELGIGRPSTYAPIISTIQQRGYVSKGNKPALNRDITIITLDNNTVKEKIKKESYGYEKAKLFPTDTGMIVNDYLMTVFPEIMDYNFTANIEKKLDDVAEGSENWVTILSNFYNQFHPKLKELETSKERVNQERFLGEDPKTGKKVFVKYGKFGPIVQLGESSQTEKPKFASLKKNQYIESISLEEAMELFNLPRTLGQLEGNDIIVNIGRFGPYVLHNKKFYSLKRNVDDPYTITLERAIEIINEKNSEKSGPLREFNEDKDVTVLKGRYGVYIKYKDKNIKIPKGFDWEKATYNEIITIVNQSLESKPKKK